MDDLLPLRVSPPREMIYIEDDRDLIRRRSSRFEEDQYVDYDSDVEYIPRRLVNTLPLLPSPHSHLPT